MADRPFNRIQAAWDTVYTAQRHLNERADMATLDLDALRGYHQRLLYENDQLTYAARNQSYPPDLRGDAAKTQSQLVREIERIGTEVQYQEAQLPKVSCRKTKTQVRKDHVEQSPVRQLGLTPNPTPMMSAKQAAQALIVMREKYVTRAGIPLDSLDRSQLIVRRTVVTKSMNLADEVLCSSRLSQGLRSEVQTIFQELAKERREIDRLLSEGHAAERDKWAAKRARVSQARTEDTVKAPEPPATRVPFVILGGDAPPSLPALRNHIRLFHRPEPGDVYDDSRLEFLYTFYPTKLYAGRDEFNRYYVIEFAHFHAAVFECPRVGNAVYIVELSAWQIWARKSKSELWHDQSGSVRRILHRGEWRPRLRKALDSFRIRTLEKESPARPIAPDALD